ncbi:hypothetical protein BC936DRAFT_149624 [Jimgerdemannia flammicorona]|uniref:Gfo/Idh/MocA-like oxidoreductase C-terminal domain-containing protein n=1 Tax=Jimgerdemannia flammicorona TaxID=994334 RepID=A0A433D0G8_9FUNG|nr:hypothetical protein BC936DRAFT_149624 [Jimgerdemannia flammicorona]
MKVRVVVVVVAVTVVGRLRLRRLHDEGQGLADALLWVSDHGRSRVRDAPVTTLSHGAYAMHFCQSPSGGPQEARGQVQPRCLLKPLARQGREVCTVRECISLSDPSGLVNELSPPVISANNIVVGFQAGLPADKVYDDAFELIRSPNIDVLDVIVPIQHNLETDKVVFIAENLGYKPLTRQVAQIFQSGTIGELVTFSYHAIRTYSPDSPFYATKWRQSPEHPGGYLSDGGVHDICTLTTVVGQIDEVAAFSTSRYPIHGSEDTLTVTLKLKSGAIGTFILTFCATKPTKTALFLHGTGGSIQAQFDRSFDGADEKLDVHDAQGIPVPHATSSNPRGLTDVEGELDNLFGAIRGTEKLVVTLEDAFHHLAVIVAAIQSAKDGKVVKVERI